MTVGWMIFLFVIPLAVLWGALLIDLVRRNDITLAKKLLWGGFTLATAEFGAIVYILMRPIRYPEDGVGAGAENDVVEQLLEAVETGDSSALSSARNTALSRFND